MKKIFFYLSLTLLVGFASCSSDDDDIEETHEYVVLDLNSFDLDKNGIETAGGKYWNKTFTNEVLKHSIFTFSHSGSVAETWKTWDGFVVSNSKDNSKQQESDWTENQWANMAKGGQDGESKNYLVAFWSNYKDSSAEKGKFDETKYSNWIKIGDNTDSYKAIGVYVSNAAWTYYTITEGNAFAEKFEKGDYFILRAYGVKADNTITAPIEYYLADYRTTEKINNKWEWVDLSALGEVKYIYFQMETTDNDQYGPKTTTMYCLDKLKVEKL